MKGWAKQLAGSVLVLLLAAGVLGFVLVLRAQQNGVGATMAAAHIRAVSPPDGATNVPIGGEIRVEYISRPSLDPTIKLEPPPDVTLAPGHWDGSTYVLPYSGLRTDSLYHLELDQDDSTSKGEHKQIKVRWSFRTGSGGSAPTPRPSTPVSATPTPSGVAPTPLIWYRGASIAANGSAYGVDWSGKQVKTINIPTMILQSPDGSRLWTRQAPVLNSDGQVAGSVYVDQQMLWADDGQEFCGIAVHPTGVYDLDLLTLDGSRHRVATLTLPGQVSPPQTPALVACSALNGRAVITGSNNGYIWSVMMISLANGSVIYQRTYPNPVTRMVASHDGRFIAEQLPGNGPPTIIRELSSGNQVGQLADVAVQAFSWDGALVGVSTGTTPGTAPQAMVIRWQTHQTLWHLCTCPSPATVSVLAQPGGTKLAVIAGWNHQATWSFTIVDADGTTKSVPVANTPVTPAF